VSGSRELSAESSSDVAKLEVRILREAEFFRSPTNNIRNEAEFGFHRTLWYGLRGTHTTTSVVVLPVGQSCEPHSSPAEHIITVLSGRLFFSAGAHSIDLLPFDQIFVPPGVEYWYRNTARTDTWFFNVVAHVAKP